MMKAAFFLGAIPYERFGNVKNWMRPNRLRYTLQQCNVGASKQDEWVIDYLDDIYNHPARV